MDEVEVLSLGSDSELEDQADEDILNGWLDGELPTPLKSQGTS